MSNKIPQYEPIINHNELADELHDYIACDKGWLTEFKYTREFEAKIKEQLKVKHCFMVNNGTISLSLALLAEGIKPGDLVAVPSMTMFATASAVELIGAKPMFVDMAPQGVMCPKDLIRVLASWKIKTIIYVTLNGLKPSSYTQIVALCKDENIKIIEDNAQSFGSKDWEGNLINCPENGIGSFSFSMPKIITTGQGGCLVTNNDELSDKIRQLRDFGRMEAGGNEHLHFGINAKFTEMQALTGLNQIKNIDERIEIKKKNYDLYLKYLTDVNNHVIILDRPETRTPWFTVLYVLGEEKDKLMAHLTAHGIGVRNVYQPLDSFGYYKDSTVTKNSLLFFNHAFWMPSSLTLKEDEIKFICDTLKKYYEVK